MTCRNYRDHLQEYLEETLEAGFSRELRAHLDACPECRRQWQREQAVERTLRAALGHATAHLFLSPEAKTTILHAARATAPRQSAVRVGRHWLNVIPVRGLAAAAAFAGVLLCTVLVSRHDSADPHAHRTARADRERFTIDVPFQSDRQTGVSHADFSALP